jgi:hypothetical protein
MPLQALLGMKEHDEDLIIRTAGSEVPVLRIELMNHSELDNECGSSSGSRACSPQSG